MEERKEPEKPKTLREQATYSGAERWRNCPASVAMSAGIEEGEKKYASQGTKAHKVGAKALIENTPLEEIADEAVREYVGMVRRLAEPPYHVEERLPLLGTSGGLDCYTVSGKIGSIFDFKYGVGIRLNAYENEQLAGYACCLKEKYPQITQVFCVLSQPRVEGVFEETSSFSTWTLGYQALAAWRRKFEAALIEVEKAERICAGDWCQFCKARGGCPAHVSYADSIYREQETAELPGELLPVPVQELPLAQVPQIARIYAAKKRVESWFDKAEEYLLFLAKKGVEIPGFELAPKRTNRKWHSMMDEEEIAKALRERGIEEPWRRKLVPITYAEDFCDVDDLTEKPEGALGLKPIKAPRVKK